MTREIWLEYETMDTVLTPEEKRLVAHAKQAIVKYNKIRHAHGGIDTLYAFLLSARLCTFPTQ